MNDYLTQVNSLPFYLIVAAVLIFVVTMCVIFLVKSYKAGIALGMDPKDLKKVMTSSATFTLLPSISILLGVIALSGTLGVPFSWLRLPAVRRSFPVHGVSLHGRRNQTAACGS